MFRNHLVTAVRNLSRRKGYAFINIFGLALGLTSCILIMLWVMQQISYDRFHERSDDIYRVATRLSLGGSPRAGATTSPPMGPAILAETPEVLQAVRFSSAQTAEVRFERKVFNEDQIRYADSTFFSLFSFSIKIGETEGALSAPYTVVLTEETAERYFGDRDPIGRLLKFDNDHEYRVTAVMADVPVNSHFDFDMLCSFQTLYAEERQELNQWGFLGYYTYLLLRPEAHIEDVEGKMATLVEQNLGDRLKAVGGSLVLFLQPLTDIHLHSDLSNELAAGGDIQDVYLFSTVALLILLVACFNFVNITTARSAGRAVEIGVRKAIGAFRGQLLRQFLVETTLYGLVAMTVAAGLVEIILPFFNDLTGADLSTDYFGQPWLIGGMAGMLLLIGVAAGSYPAMLLSSFRPVQVLKGGFRAVGSGARLRKALVVAQFAVSITLIIGTLSVYRQVVYLKNKELGYDKEQLVILPNAAATDNVSIASLKDELSRVPGVAALAASSEVPSSGGQMTNFIPEGYTEDEAILMRTTVVDESFIGTLGMELVAGRSFSLSMPTDTLHSAIVNETAVRTFGWTDPIGKTIKRREQGPDGDPYWADYYVIGVVRDFHQSSLLVEIEPLFIRCLPSVFRMLTVRLSPGDVSNTMGLLEEKWTELLPERNFNYYFLEDRLNQQYQQEESLARIIFYFSLLAILLGCLGLFGLISYAAEQRSKEIGIRKVLGASVSGIVGILSREMLLLVGVANVVAWPVAYWLMKGWYEQYPYRAGIEWTLFVAAAVSTLVIAFTAMSFQAVRAARGNPVEAIRCE